MNCRHCDEPIVRGNNGQWIHTHGLYRCQTKVPYGHNVAPPDEPCTPGGPNPCLCTYGGPS